MKKYKLSFDDKAFIVIGALTIFKLLYTIGFDVIPDEAYYYLWGQNLQLSYFDHPPMIAYAFALLSMVFKSIPFVVHLLPILLGAATSIYAYYFAKNLFGELIAFTYLVLSNLTLVMFAGSIIATPDTLMIFFLTAGMYHFHKATTSGKWLQWILVGIMLGFGLLSKYVTVLIFPALLFYLIFTQKRSWLRTAKPYISLLISLIFFLPVIVWNMQNDWISFSFQITHGIGGSFPNWQTIGDYLGGQLGLLGPLLFIIFVIAIVKVIAEWKYHSETVKMLFFIALVFFGFFLISSLQKKVEANWPAFAYVPGILLVVYAYMRYWQEHVGWRITWVVNWFLLVIVLLVVLVQVYVPVIPIKYDPTDQFYGWKRAGEDAASIIREFPTLIPAANRHQIASELIIYSGYDFVCFDLGNRPHQFTLWRDDKALQGKDFLLFDVSKKLNSVAVNNFENVKYLTSYPRVRGLKMLQIIKVYVAKNYLGDMGK